jgi:hypothetical protein
MKFVYFLFLILCSAVAYAQEQVVPYPLESPKQAKAPEIPEDLKGMVWNKWTTKNFIILSIDKNQGIYLKNNIEKIKTWLLNRWGLSDVDFEGECKVVCVSDKRLLKRIFRLDNSKFEVRKDQNGNVQTSIIWFSLEDYDRDMAMFELMNICLYQFENKYKKSLPSFCKKGMSFLSQQPEIIKQKILEEPVTEISFEKDLKEAQCGVLCLLLRKEYGQDNFVRYLSNDNLDSFGFKQKEKFDEILNRYYRNLLEDIKTNKIPNEYLKIKNRR